MTSPAEAITTLFWNLYDQRGQENGYGSPLDKRSDHPEDMEFQNFIALLLRVSRMWAGRGGDCDAQLATMFLASWWSGDANLGALRQSVQDADDPRNFVKRLSPEKLTITNLQPESLGRSISYIAQIIDALFGTVLSLRACGGTRFPFGSQRFPTPFTILFVANTANISRLRSAMNAALLHDWTLQPIATMDNSTLAKPRAEGAEPILIWCLSPARGQNAQTLEAECESLKAALHKQIYK
jgi:hypothetical protein